MHPSIQRHFLVLPLERGSEYNTAYRQIPAVPQWVCLSAAVLWNIVDIPAAACISLTSTAAYGTHKCHWCHFPWLHSGCDSWIAHSLSLECQHKTHYEFTSRLLTSRLKSGETNNMPGEKCLIWFWLTIYLNVDREWTWLINGLWNSMTQRHAQPLL